MTWPPWTRGCSSGAPSPSPALTAAEADGYLRAHLAHAGRTDTLFSDDAVRVIHGHARGMPRAINRLAITALLAACTAGQDHRRRIIRPHRHRRGSRSRDRLTTTAATPSTQPRPAAAGRG